MKRNLIIALILLSLPSLTDFAVDHFHEPEHDVGYSKADRDGMERIMASLPTHDEAVAMNKKMTKAQKIEELWGQQ